MIFSRTMLAAIIATAAMHVAAHPGHDVQEEIAERAAYFGSKHAKRSLDHCAQHLEKRGINKRAMARREATITALRRNALLKSTSVIILFACARLTSRQSDKRLAVRNARQRLLYLPACHLAQ
jgi:hypothetical protein